MTPSDDGQQALEHAGAHRGPLQQPHEPLALGVQIRPRGGAPGQGKSNKFLRR
jgi:hypothetical protein